MIAGPCFLSVAVITNFLSFFILRSRSILDFSRLNMGGPRCHFSKASVVASSKSFMASLIGSRASGGS